MKVRYSSNNSGGYWWLTGEQWQALEAAGWIVEWLGAGGRRMSGTMAHAATREGLSLEDAIREFERITGEEADAEGCPCCGPPHNFYVER